MPSLYDSVQFVSGIGPKKVKLLGKLHIHTLQDALETYPRDYEDRTVISPIAALEEDEKGQIRAVVGTAPQIARLKGGLKMTTLTVFDESGTLRITFFHNTYAAGLLSVGQEYLFYGTVTGFGRGRSMTNPQFERIAPDKAHKGRIVPVYPLVAGLSQRDLKNVTTQALLAVPGAYPDPLPMHLRMQYDLPNLEEALLTIHRPKSMDEMQQARRRMIFEELFLLSCGLQQIKVRRKRAQGIQFARCDLSAFFGALPFQPTGAQKRAIDEVVHDVQSGFPMNRLLQGDVGAGKTVVAAALLALCAQNGYQSALMAPTEILAAQHAQSLAGIFDALGITCVLLTGSMGAAKRRQVNDLIVTGAAKVIIGTHALIQDTVAFSRLGAIVVDEQHRFGVSQRAALTQKGEAPHTLAMSATPIPRTLALLLYGDLDVSILDEIPPGRTPIQSYAVGEEMRERITKFIDKQVAAGGQCYVVCPAIAPGELPIKSAEEHAETLRTLLPQRRIGLLHGKMKAADKEAVMAQFTAGDLDILVSTTVIEVGVDVPNATLMVVEDADRFGLSQLHQLRGRVGRGGKQSYCIFFGADKGKLARERLRVLTSTTDGFQISKADLALRGPGDFFGMRQSGLPALHVAHLESDLALMRDASEEAQKVLAETPDLSLYPILQERVSRMFANSEENLIDFL